MRNELPNLSGTNCRGEWSSMYLAAFSNRSFHMSGRHTFGSKRTAHDRAKHAESSCLEYFSGRSRGSSWQERPAASQFILKVREFPTACMRVRSPCPRS